VNGIGDENGNIVWGGSETKTWTERYFLNNSSDGISVESDLTGTGYVDAVVKYGNNHVPYLDGNITYNGLSRHIISGLTQNDEYVDKAQIPKGEYYADPMRLPNDPANYDKMTDADGNVWFIPISSDESKNAGWTGLGIHPAPFGFTAGCPGVTNADDSLYDMLIKYPLLKLEIRY